MAKFKPSTPNQIPNDLPSTPSMPPIARRRSSDEHSGYATATSTTSDTQSSDEYTAISPLRRQQRDQAESISTPISRKTGHRHDQIAKAGPSRGVEERATPTGSSKNVSAPPGSSHKTPSKPSATPAGTPSGRFAAIDSVFKKHASPSPSRPRSQRQEREAPMLKQHQVIIVEDTDEEDEVPGASNPSVTPQRPKPVSSESSQSSINSLFSNMSMSSSQTSVGSVSISAPVKYSRAPERRPIPRDTHTPSRDRTAPLPAVVDDVFSGAASPNVTQRRTQRTEQRPPTPVSEPKHSEAQRSEAIEQHIPRAVQIFANSLFGTDLDVAMIAHCPKTQKMLDDKKIEWGTQFELARGVTTGSWTWEDVQAHISDFIGSNAVAARKVPSVMLGRPLSASVDSNIWKELDREQAAIQENKGRGLGLMGEWKGSVDWYGGRFQQIGRILKNGNSYKIVLEPCETKRSYRFARFYGSRRFLYLGIPDDILKNENDKVKNFLTKKFVLCGRTFEAFHAKDSHVYMVETDEDHDRTPQDWCGDQFRMPFRDFVNWHNPLDQHKNFKQVISKYSTRFALGLSNSVPVLEFQEENIMFIDDITAEDWPAEDKNPPAEKLMTDGCGFINHYALHQIVKRLGYDSIPAAIQGRIDGSKGLWILHPTDKSLDPKIWIRSSQNKIKNRSFDRAHRILDLLEPSKPSAPIALSKQSIVNVFSNGIPQEMLVHMMEEGLEREIAPLLEWEKPYAMLALWDTLNKLNNISGTRTKRLSASLNRALGLEHRDWGHETISGDLKEIVKPEDALSTAVTRRNPYSGEPESFSEFTVELLQCGFHPTSNKLLHDKLKFIISEDIKSSVTKYRIPIEESLGAYIIPDPLGILEEGEVSYRFSTPRTDPNTSMQIHAVEGPVLVGRYPIRLPSDIQKAFAVNRRELDRWCDVLIVSTKGKRSLASLLAGGDMDGDEIIMIYLQALVDAFQNQPFTDAPPNFLQDNFTRSVESVEAFCERVGRLSQREAHEAFQHVLIANLSEDNVGLYSSMHENAIIKYGYGNEQSIRLAYIFATLLDSSKSGWLLKPGLFKWDSAKYSSYNMVVNPNSAAASRDILSLLAAAGQRKGDELLKRYHAIESTHVPDSELLQPYDTAASYALKAGDRKIPHFNEEMREIRKHVDAAYNMWLEACSKSRALKDNQASPTKHGKNSASKKAKVEVEAGKLAASRAYAEPIDDICLTPNVEQVKASYAYKLSPYFGFFVGFQELCHIKANNSPGGHAPTLRIFDEAKTISTSFMRALRRSEEERDY